MDVSGIAKTATTIAETGNRQEVATAVFKRALQIESAAAAQLIDAAKAAPAIRNLPPHLGTNIDTTA